MSLLPRKGVLAITAVIDVALNARNGPVNSRALAKRQHLGPRYLESELQALVREGILKAVRGPHGGYVRTGRADFPHTALRLASSRGPRRSSPLELEFA